MDKLFRDQGSINKTRVIPITFSLVLLLLALPSLHIPIVHGATYVPGVKIGDWVDYGQLSFQGNGNSFNVQDFIHTIDLNSTVTDVHGNNVTLLQTAKFDNGTDPRSVVLQGDLATGRGNLTFALIAGGLTAGDPVTQTPALLGGLGAFASVINETVTRQYAGALRTVNVGIQEPSLPGVTLRSTAYWDAQSGFALELSLYSFIPAGILSPSSPSSSITIHLKATSTNIWTPSTTPDFGLDITPLSSFVLYQGSSDIFSVNLTSFGSFTGTVNLQTQVSQTNSSVINKPTLSVTSSLSLASGQSTQSSLEISATTLTDLGLYLLTVNATSDSLRQDAIFTVEVVPPDFALLPTAVIVSVPQGTTVSTTMTVNALGAFSGPVLLSQFVFQPGLQISLNTTSVILSPGRPVNIQLNATAPSDLASTTYFGTVTADSGSQSHFAYLIIDVVHVSPPVIAVVSVSPNPANTGASVALSFSVYSLVDVTGISVNWGDDTTTHNLAATATSATHVYAPIGSDKSRTLKITINATNVAGTGTSTFLEVVTDRLPTTSITGVLPPSVYAGHTFTLNFATADADGTVSSVSVDWGDGTNTALGGTATQAPHSYTSSGTFKINVTTTDNSGNTAFATYTMIIPHPDFTVASTSPSSTTIGQAASSTITITANSGFTGTINLSVTTQPSGPSCTATPSSITQAQTATVSCSSTTAGTYTITVTATSGSTSHQSTASMTFTEPASPASPQPTTILGLAPVLFYGLIGVLVVLVITSVAVVIRRKST